MTHFSGTGRKSQALNELAKQVRSTQASRSPGVLTSQTTAGITRKAVWRPKRGGASSAVVKRYVIVSVQGDYLTCKESAADGTAGTGPDVKVAKPKPLRSSTFATGIAIGGVTFPLSSVHVTTRTSVPLGVAGGGFSAGATFSEVLTPDYVAGDNDIYASENDTGVTDCDWIDLNASARKYLPIKTEVKVCVIEGGQQVSKKIVISGGPIYT